MSKVVNLAKGRTYICTCETNTIIQMGSGDSAVEVTIEAPQGLFVATAEIGVVDNDSAVIKQLFYSSAASGIGTKPIKLATEFNPEDDTMAVSGALVYDAVKEMIGVQFSAQAADEVPDVDTALENTIYLVATESGSTNYNEWLKVKMPDGSYAMEQLGTANIVDALTGNAESTALVAEKALYFIDPSGVKSEDRTGGISITYDVVSEANDNINSAKFTLKREDDKTRMGVTYYDNSAIPTEKSFCVDDLIGVADYGFVQEAGTDLDVDVENSLIDSRVEAILSSRTPQRVELTSGGSAILVEDGIGHISTENNLTTIDLSKVTCIPNATAELWVDVKSSGVPITFPTATWIDSYAPTTLAANTRYVFVIRNDGTEEEGHLLMHLAYHYEI